MDFFYIILFFHSKSNDDEVCFVHIILNPRKTLHIYYLLFITYIAIYKMISFFKKKILEEKIFMSFLIIGRENKIQYTNCE